MSPENVVAKIHDIFRQRLRVEVPSPESDLFATGALDSLVFVELLVALEEEFERKIPLADLEVADFRSIAAISQLLTRDGRSAAAVT